MSHVDDDDAHAPDGSVRRPLRLISEWVEFPIYLAMSEVQVTVPPDEVAENETVIETGTVNRVRLNGGRYPHTYKTIAGARASARTRAGAGLVLLFDLARLPVVLEDHETDGLKLTETEFAERQMELWGKRLAELEAFAKDERKHGLTMERVRARREAKKAQNAARREHRKRLKEEEERNRALDERRFGNPAAAADQTPVMETVADPSEVP